MYEVQTVQVNYFFNIIFLHKCLNFICFRYDVVRAGGWVTEILSEEAPHSV